LLADVFHQSRQIPSNFIKYFFDGLWCFLMAFDGRCFPSKPSNPIKLHQIYFFDGLWCFLMAFGGRCFPSKPSNPVKLHQIYFLMAIITDWLSAASL